MRKDLLKKGERNRGKKAKLISTPFEIPVFGLCVRNFEFTEALGNWMISIKQKGISHIGAKFFLKKHSSYVIFQEICIYKTFMFSRYG